MSGARQIVENFVDFRDRMASAVRHYEKVIRPRLETMYRALDPIAARKEKVDAELEDHIRVYVLDAVLSALNWNVDENLTIEAPVRSEETSTRRFLDYLGVEKSTMSPLLLVEAKRPSSPRPMLAKPPVAGVSPTTEAILASALNALKNKSTSPTGLHSSWDKWVRDLFDYTRSLKVAPVRALITNGDWFVLFQDPRNAFFGGDDVDPAQIVFFENRRAVVRRASEFFDSLNYHRIVPNARPLKIGDMRALIADCEPQFAIRATKITSVTTPDGLGVVPTIHLVAELLLVHQSGAWTRVQDEVALRLPHKPDQVAEHLRDSAARHEELYSLACSALGRRVPLLRISDGFGDSLAGKAVPAVQKIESTPDSAAYLALLGSESHFVRNPGRYASCLYHSGVPAMAAGLGIGFLVAGPSSEHGTNFGEGGPYHCAHKRVREIRASQIDAQNRGRFLPRGAVEDGPFCKLWGFEKLLCCRSCVYQEVCLQSVEAIMPCSATERAELSN